MEPPQSAELTSLLKAWTEGNASALDRLLESVYDELHRMARRFMRNERLGQTFQTTALINEAYLKLVDVKNVDWRHRGQFFALAAQIMRRILVDAARARACGKRGAGAQRVSIDDAGVFSTEPDTAIVALDRALEEFAALAPRQARVVELRYFGGLTVEEIAGLTRSSSRTVERDWRFARSWLLRELSRANS